ncbi:hypothetical protein [Variovorax boronicumulans]|uniref:hypothetical protein n=1 Tax=Variovorax boronicumulans TaxID=436515 RepID=UPI001F0B68D6|nr:hypothetical protein [Variovorax boronicumulans]
MATPNYGYEKRQKELAKKKKKEEKLREKANRKLNPSSDGLAPETRRPTWHRSNAIPHGARVADQERMTPRSWHP